MKLCRTCNLVKSLTMFSKDKTHSDGLRSKCVQCVAIYRKKTKEQRKLSKKIWEDANPDKVKAQSRRSYLKKSSKLGVGRNNKLPVNLFLKKEVILARRRYQEWWKRQLNVDYKIKKNIRIRLNKALRGNLKNSSAWSSVGCSMVEFRSKMEAMFYGSMTWDNYGYNWEIDHIIPLTFFNLTDTKQAEISCHLSNLQPLTASDNSSKSNNILNVDKLLLINSKLIESWRNEKENN